MPEWRIGYIITGLSEDSIRKVRVTNKGDHYTIQGYSYIESYGPGDRIDHGFDKELIYLNFDDAAEALLDKTCDRVSQLSDEIFRLESICDPIKPRKLRLKRDKKEWPI